MTFISTGISLYFRVLRSAPQLVYGPSDPAVVRRAVDEALVGGGEVRVSGGRLVLSGSLQNLAVRQVRTA